MFRYSISGAPTSDYVRITLDGVEIPFKGAGTMDRTFDFVWSNVGFSAGNHIIRVEQGTKKPGAEDVELQLCNYEITEYMPENRYHTGRDYIGAYNTYRLGNTLVGYRPDHETCLMRNMSSPDFCVVCLEGMWMNLLGRMELIDNVAVTVDKEEGAVLVQLNAVPLAQLRTGGPLPGEKYTVSWAHNNVVRPDLQDVFEWKEAFALNPQGNWQVRLQYITTEIRSDPNGHTQSTKPFVVNLN